MPDDDERRIADLFDLSGRVAVVTGGSRGIGRAIAQGLAAAGADVVIASRKAENCREAAVDIEQSTGRRALAVACHVGRWDDCDRLVATVDDEFGRCDVLVNNAGMSPLYDDLASVTEEYYDKVSAVNLKGPFRLSALFGTRMAAADGGSIINVSTIGSLRPGSRELVYVMVANRASRGLAGMRMHSRELDLDQARRAAHERTPFGWLKEDGDLNWFEQQLYLRQPGYGTSYVTGKYLLEDLMRVRKQQLGKDFTLKGWFDEVNGASMIPVPMIHWQLTGHADEERALRDGAGH